MLDIEAAKDDPARYQAWLGVRYGIVYNQLQCRFYRRRATELNLAGIVAGSTGFGAFVVSWPGLAAVAGLLIAIVGGAGAAIDCAGRAARFEILARRYADLDLETPHLATVEVDARLAELQRDVQAGEIEALAQIAYNANLAQNGRSDALVPTTWFERAAARLA